MRFMLKPSKGALMEVHMLHPSLHDVAGCTNRIRHPAAYDLHPGALGYLLEPKPVWDFGAWGVEV